MEDLSLVPGEFPQSLAEGEGGSYYSWNSTLSSYLGSGKVSGGKLILKPNGFALPHYSDCNKIGFVLRGNDGVAGMVYPSSSEEIVVKLKKGDFIAVPSGVVSWWSNAGNDELHIIFLGQTHAANEGQFTYCLLVGTGGILRGFSNESICKAYGVNEEQANQLRKSQKEALIIKLDDGITMPKPSKHDHHAKTLLFNCDEHVPEFHVEKGGSLNIFSAEKHPSLEEVKLSANLLKLDPNAMFGPIYYGGDSGVQIFYVVKGSGWVQVVAMNGKIVLDTPLKAGYIFSVPKFYVVVIGARDEGIKCFSVVTSPKPIVGQLAGKMSIWKALSPQVLQASLNISPELRQLFMERINETSIIRSAP